MQFTRRNETWEMFNFSFSDTYNHLIETSTFLKKNLEHNVSKHYEKTTEACLQSMKMKKANQNVKIIT
jgi:hypothetical protein